MYIFLFYFFIQVITAVFINPFSWLYITTYTTISLLSILIYYKKYKKVCIFNEKINFKNIIITIIYTYIFINILSLLIYFLNPELSNQRTLEYIFINGNKFFVSISVIILAPILEEIVFRYSLYNTFKNKSISFFVSTLLFAFLHSGLNTANLFIYFLLGAIFASIYYYTKSLKLSIIAHIFNNLLSMLGLFLWV